MLPEIWKNLEDELTPPHVTCTEPFFFFLNKTKLRLHHDEIKKKKDDLLSFTVFACAFYIKH